MNKQRRILIIFSLVLSCLLAGCGSVKEPEFRSIRDLRVSQVGLSESTLFLDMHYYNPNKFGIKLKEAEGDAWLEDKLLGHFFIDTLIHIPAAADFLLPIQLKADMGQLLKNSVALLLNKEVTVRLKGSARFGKGFVYIRYPILYEGKHKLADLVR
ncbi:MAG: LEA type 2 family protein [Chitinophagaceae bacterium]